MHGGIGPGGLLLAPAVHDMRLGERCGEVERALEFEGLENGACGLRDSRVAAVVGLCVGGCCRQRRQDKAGVLWT